MTTKQIYKSVVGVFRDRFAADTCFDELIQRGYLASNINIMMTAQTRSRDYAWNDEDSPTATSREGTMGGEGGGGMAVATAPERMAGTAASSMAVHGVGVGGSIGTAVGATLAAIVAVGTSLVIPGLNLIVAGPIIAALAGGGVGAVAGGLVGGLVGLGFTEQDAEIYNQALQSGGVVMSVEALVEDSEEIKSLMIKHSGEQVSCCRS